MFASKAGDNISVTAATRSSCPVASELRSPRTCPCSTDRRPTAILHLCQDRTPHNLPTWRRQNELGQACSCCNHLREVTNKRKPCRGSPTRNTRSISDIPTTVQQKMKKTQKGSCPSRYAAAAASTCATAEKQETVLLPSCRSFTQIIFFKAWLRLLALAFLGLTRTKVVDVD